MHQHAQLKDIEAQCRKHGMRITHALRSILTILCESHNPVNLSAIEEHPSLAGQTDPSTLYRTLERLCKQGIARPIGLHGRSQHYILQACSCHHDYIVCLECEDIAIVDAPCPAHALQNKISKQTGYQDLYHELVFYGRCPKCSAKKNALSLATDTSIL